MAGTPRVSPFKHLLTFVTVTLGLLGCSASQPAAQPAAKAAPLAAAPAHASPLFVAPTPEPAPAVMLGIDVLEAEGFAAVKGKRIGLLTHPAGVNRRGERTIDVLRRAPGVKLVALFAVEHGINSEFPASQNYNDYVDKRTGLPVFSLYDGKSTKGKTGRPTPAQLRGIDALVVDLQDIGVRSYTFSTRMNYAIAGCFENGVEVIVLDRPNPLGGLKVDGPSLDYEFKSGVGAFQVPYVHGLTIGELARMAAGAPRVLEIPEEVRAKGRLTVIPMRGWRRDMRWTETGLNFVPTSQGIQDFSAVMGYAMVGLGCEFSGFTHGIGKSYQFRGIYFKGKSLDQLEADLNALRLPGLKFRRVSAPDEKGQPKTGVFVEVADWDDWNPTELSFHLMRLACRYNPPNPFAKLSPINTRSFNIHVGSAAWMAALKRDGAKVDVEGFLRDWREKAKAYQQQSRRYWLYP